ncbi:unnamed protein product [Timema podura]|uniref:Uncharacterized protein n=1 Tax=Timema podura TaxID=61482 RepID=A0ABN7PEF6_TIMPD|nr:unnamed protein product [Timema podura]
MAEEKPKTMPKYIKFLFGGLAGYFILILTCGIKTRTLTNSDSSRLQLSEMKFLRTTIQGQSCTRSGMRR